jgi:hypothetical protein
MTRWPVGLAVIVARSHGATPFVIARAFPPLLKAHGDGSDTLVKRTGMEDAMTRAGLSAVAGQLTTC